MIFPRGSNLLLKNFIPAHSVLGLLVCVSLLLQLCGQSPRVALQLAISTDGQLYGALTQVNTDQHVFCLFITGLAKRLSEEDNDWQSDTILLIDGAKYGTCKESIRHMRKLGFRVCVSAPYSYSSAPIEYAFCFLKSVDLNPGNIKTGKR